MKPKVSVLMSIHNQSEFANEAINSILDQSFTNFEFIIINDSSDDKTSKALSKINDKRVRVFSNSTKVGLTKSLNKGLAHAKAKYIARMDADDVSLKNRLKTQYQYLEKNLNITACGTDAILIDRYGKRIGIKEFPKSYLDIKKDIIKYNPIIHPSVMMRTDKVKTIGGYNESLNGAEDYDLWLRLAINCEVVNLPRLLLKYRINPKGVSWTRLKYVEFQAIKARLKALQSLGYPKWQVIYLIKPILSFIIPANLKRKIFGIQ